MPIQYGTMTAAKSEVADATARRRWLIAAAIVAVLFSLQSLRRVGAGPWGTDGSYYYQVARHVADGDGLLTSVCLYNQGLRTLPTHTNIYPMWPLLLGLAGRVIPLAAAATLLPRLFYVGCLILLYVLVDRMCGRRGYLPHAAVAVLGLQPLFFLASVYPYTDGMALFLTSAALLMLDRALRSQAAVDYGLCGVLSALAFLTRSQMLMTGVAIGIVLVVLAARRRAGWLSVAAFSGGFAAGVLPWVIHLSTFIRPFRVSALFAMHSETAGLPPFDQKVRTVGAFDYVLDRLGGLAVMFDPFSDQSFVASFGPVAFLVPLALLYVAYRRQWRGGILAAAVAVTGIALCGVLLESHQRYLFEWLFGYRHGFPFILLIAVAMVLLDGRYARVIVALLVVASLIVNTPRTVAYAFSDPGDWPGSAEKELVAWLERNDPDAIVLTTKAQELSVASRANFRWAACGQPPQDIRRVIELVRTDFVLVYEHERQCAFASGLESVAQPVAMFGRPPQRLMLLEVRR